MKTIVSVLIAFGVAVQVASGDSLTLASGRMVKGTVIQTNDAGVAVQNDIGMFTYPMSIIKGIQTEKAEAEVFHATSRLPDQKTLLVQLGSQPWAANLKQIPSTVIEKGILRNVPYVSYRCGEDYEVNIYGELDQPAGIEIGVYRSLLGNDTAKRNCLAFVEMLLGQAGDKETLKKLSLVQDKQTREGLTLEITPPTIDDAYGGWWVSAYSEQKLKLARASDAELQGITVNESVAAQKQVGDGSSWSADEMKLARQPQVDLISFTSPSGELITNAEVVRVIEGYALLWRQGTKGGLVKLADLPEELRVKYGYDPAKAALAEESERTRLARVAQAQIQAAQTAQQPVQTVSAERAPVSGYGGGAGLSYSSDSSSGGRVYVRGYTRRDGTYVHSYSRRR